MSVGKLTGPLYEDREMVCIHSYGVARITSFEQVLGLWLVTALTATVLFPTSLVRAPPSMPVSAPVPNPQQ